MIKRVIILALIALLLTAGVVFAFSGSFDRYVISSGGGRTESGKFSIHASVGQSVAGVKVNGPYELHSGFWFGYIPKYISYFPSILN